MVKLTGLHNDSLIGIFSILTYLIANILQINILTNIVGIVVLIWVPGSLFIRMLYPKDDQLDFVERGTLSFACSFCLVPAVGFALDRLWIVNQQTILGLIMLISWGFIAIAYIRMR